MKINFVYNERNKFNYTREIYNSNRNNILLPLLSWKVTKNEEEL